MHVNEIRKYYYHSCVVNARIHGRQNTTFYSEFEAITMKAAAFEQMSKTFFSFVSGANFGYFND